MIKNIIKRVYVSKEQDLKDFQVTRAYFKKNVTSYTYIFFSQALAALSSQMNNTFLGNILLLPIFIFFIAGIVTIEYRLPNFSHKKRMKAIPIVILFATTIWLFLITISLFT